MEITLGTSGETGGKRCFLAHFLYKPSTTSDALIHNLNTMNCYLYRVPHASGVIRPSLWNLAYERHQKFNCACSTCVRQAVVA